MNYFNTLEQLVNATLEDMAQAGELPSEALGRGIAVDPPRDPAHGDAATNAAMVLAKPAGLNPRELGEALAARLAGSEWIETAEVAGPGFVNLRLTTGFWHARLKEILQAGTAYGEADFGRGRKVNVEYVSANPTGPLHIAHARGAVVGDALASLLAKTGYEVTREYYINDAGAQVEALARSAYMRYREACGISIDAIPEGLYPGEYLVPVGEALAVRDGEKWLEAPEAEWLPAVREFTVAMMMEGIREDLKLLGIEQTVFASERALVEAGAVEAALEALTEKGLIYRGVLEPPKGVVPEDWEEREQTLFRASEFGDDTDRPLMKSDGSYTYFANDIAYHYDKYRRGFATQIDVWGADHGGYVKRMKAALEAITGGEAELTVLLCQIVRLMKGGELMRMSKRAGTFVTLRDLIDEVGAGAVRFTILTRKSDAPFDFDLDKALEQSRDNPVFYVQYAHARSCSVFRNAAEAFPAEKLDPAALAAADLSLLDTEDERELIAKMAAWPRAIEGAARAFEPHRIAFYLYDLASAFHAFWNKGREDATLRFIDAEKPELTLARLALVEGLRTVIASGLELYGVEPMEELR